MLNTLDETHLYDHIVNNLKKNKPNLLKRSVSTRNVVKNNVEKTVNIEIAKELNHRISLTQELFSDGKLERKLRSIRDSKLEPSLATIFSENSCFPFIK